MIANRSVVVLPVMSVVRRPCAKTLYDPAAAGAEPVVEDPTDDDFDGSDRSRAIAVTARSSGDAHDDACSLRPATAVERVVPFVAEAVVAVPVTAATTGP